MCAEGGKTKKVIIKCDAVNEFFQRIYTNKLLLYKKSAKISLKLNSVAFSCIANAFIFNLIVHVDFPKWIMGSKT